MPEKTEVIIWCGLKWKVSTDESLDDVLEYFIEGGMEFIHFQ